MALPVLWHFTVSHFNEKVRWALDFKRIPHIRRALFFSYLPRTLWATGQPALPVLVLDGKAIADSTRIMEALERLQPEPPLYPVDERARQRALALEDFFDEELGPALRAVLVHNLFARDPGRVPEMFTAGMSAGTRRALRALVPGFRALYRLRHRISTASAAVGHAKVLAALNRIEAELGPNGYLVGDRFTVADLTAAALFYPLVQPPEYPYPWPPPPTPWFAGYRALLATRPAFQWVAEIYRRHRGTSAEVAA